MADTDALGAAAPAEDASPAAPSLGDLLHMLPLDVVADSIWHRLHCNSCRGHLRRSCRQLRDLSYHIVTNVTQDLRRPTSQAGTSTAADTASAADATKVADTFSAADPTKAAETADEIDVSSTASAARNIETPDSGVDVVQASMSAPQVNAWQQRIDRQLTFLSRLPRLHTLRLQRWASDGDLAATLGRCTDAVGARVRSLTLISWPLTGAALQAASNTFRGLEELQLRRNSGVPPAVVEDDALLPLQGLPLHTLDLSCCSPSWNALYSLVNLSLLQRLSFELPYTPTDELPNLSHQLQPLTALSGLVSLYAVLRQPRDMIPMVGVTPLFQLSLLTALRMPDVCEAEADTPLSVLADTLALLATLTRLRSLQLSRACKVGDAEFAALRQLSQLTLLAVHSIDVRHPTPGHLPQLEVLLLWHELRPAQMLRTLLPLLPLPALTRLHGFRSASQLRVCVATHAVAQRRGPLQAEDYADAWAGVVSSVYASVRPDGKEDSDCDTNSLLWVGSDSDSVDGDEEMIAAAVASCKRASDSTGGGDAVTRDAQQQAAALQQVALHLAAAPRLRLGTAALVCRQPHPSIMPGGRLLSFRQIVTGLAPLAGRLDSLVLDSWGLGVEGWAVLGTGLPGLVTLTLERCDFSAEALAAAVGHLPALDRLRLHRCVGVTAEGVQQLVAACPRPVKLHVFPALVKRPRLTGALLDQMRGLS